MPTAVVSIVSRWLAALAAGTALLVGSTALQAAPATQSSAKPAAKQMPLKIERVLETPAGMNEVNVCLVMSRQMADSPQEADLKGYLELRDLAGGAALTPRASYNGAQLCLHGLNPGHTYNLTLKRGLKSASGETLSSDLKRELKLADAPSSLSLDRGALLPMSLNEGSLTLHSVSLDKIKVYLYAISEESLAAANLSPSAEGLSMWQVRSLFHKVLSPLGEHEYQVSDARNRISDTPVRLSDFTDKAAQGFYLLLATDAANQFDGEDFDDLQEEAPHVTLARLVCVTDLGLTAYKGAQNITVAVRQLSSAEPVPGTVIKLLGVNGELLGMAEADQHGYAVFGPEAVKGLMGRRPAVITATHEQDFSALDLRQDELYFERPDARAVPENSLRLETFAYTDRGIYRPGETVHYAALVRKPDLSAAELKTAHLEVRRGDGLKFRSATLESDAAGMFSYELKLPDRGFQGDWEFRLSIDKRNPLANTRVRVSNFEPALIKTSTVTDTAKPLTVKNRKALIEVRADFNYGAPAADLNANASFAMVSSEAFFSPRSMCPINEHETSTRSASRS